MSSTKELTELMTAIVCDTYQCVGTDEPETIINLLGAFHALAESTKMDESLVTQMELTIEKERIATERHDPITTSWDIYPDEDTVNEFMAILESLEPASPALLQNVKFAVDYLHDFYEAFIS